MKISVIIPYKPEEGTAKLLGRCLNSVFNQDFNIIYLVDFDAKGVSFTRNQGLISAIRAESDYITFLDADDTYAPDAYDQMVKAIEEAPDAPIIQLQHVREFPDGRTQQRLPSPPGDYGLDRLPNLWVSVCIKLFKADLIRDTREGKFIYYDLNTSVLEDIMLWISELKGDSTYAEKSET